MAQNTSDFFGEELVPHTLPFLRWDLPLEASAALLAEAIGRRVPLAALALARADTDGQVVESAFWSTQAYPFEDQLSAWLASEGSARMLAGFGTAAEAALPEKTEAKSQEEPDLAELPEAARTALRWLALPVPGGAGPAGFVLGGKSPADGPWTAAEKAILRSMAAMFGLFFPGKGLYEAHLGNRHLAAIMEQSGTGLCVTDPSTDAILYMNQTMKDLFRIRNPEGKTCWKVMQIGRDQRCEICPVPHLLRHEGEPFVYRWEEHNSLADRVFENLDSLIRWVDGSTVHLQQSVDITDSRRFCRETDNDAVTGLSNRRAGMDALSRSLDETRAGDSALVVCMLELVSLRRINSTGGHGEGDRALSFVAESLRNSLQAPDFCFRLNGAVFVAVLHGINRYTASARLDGLLRRLERDNLENGAPGPLQVCNGLFEVPSGHDLTLAEVLTNTDQNLYERKKRFRILEKERCLRQADGAQREKPFSYDASRLYDALAASTDAYIYVSDITSGAFRYSKSMVEEFGLPGEIVENAAAVWGAKVHPADKRTFLEANQSIADGRADIHCVEYRARNRKGEWVRVRCRGHLERDEEGKPCLFAGFITPLERQDKIDHVTGLYNKIKLEEDVNALLDADPGRLLTLLVLGVDGFKQVNDLHDRLFGDEVLWLIGQKIREMLSAQATAYRLDGDEFGILIRGDKQDAYRLYRSVAVGFRFQKEYEGRKYFCTLSAGSASCPDDTNNYVDLMQCAISALRHAKAAGKDRLVFFRRKFISGRKRSLELVELLRESMERNYEGFSLVYQPQVAVESGKVTGAEALARWRCDKYGSVPPTEFVPLLEQSGLIVPFGKWVFRKAAEQCRIWSRIRPEFVSSVNLSYLQVASDDMIPFIRHTLETLQLNPANLLLEFTESCMIGENARIHAIFHDLRSLGVRIAMDDFGTGYSSLGLLKNSPADVVKIDRIFVRDILNSSFDATFIRFVVALCHDVNIKVCLEGVEREEELEVLRPMQLDYIQGYLFGKPAAPAVFERNFLAASGR